MTEPVNRVRLALALLASLLLHLFLAGGLTRFDHRRPVEPPPVLEARVLAAPPPVAAAPPPPEPAPQPVQPPRKPRPPRPAPPPPVPPPADGTASMPADDLPPAETPVLSSTEDGDDAGVPRQPDVPEPDTPADEGGDGSDDALALIAASEVLPGEASLEFDVFRGDMLNIGATRYHWVHDGQRYRMDTVTETTGLAGLLKPLRIDQSSEGEIGPQGVRPLHFTQDARQSKPPEERIDFDWQLGRVMLRSGATKSEHPLVAGSQDMASLWLEMIWRAQQGGQFDFNVATGRRYTPRWFVPDEQAVTLDTALGPLAVHRIHMRARPGDNQIEFWLAPELHWLPVRIRYTDRRGEVYDQRVRRIEYDGTVLAAAPERTRPTPAGPAQNDSDVPIFLR